MGSRRNPSLGEDMRVSSRCEERGHLAISTGHDPRRRIAKPGYVLHRHDDCANVSTGTMGGMRVANGGI